MPWAGEEDGHSAEVPSACGLALFHQRSREDRVLAALHRASISQECRLSHALGSHQSSSVSLRRKVDECPVISSDECLEPDSFPFSFSSVWPVPKRSFGKIKLIT